MASEEGQVGNGEVTARLSISKDATRHRVKAKALPVHMVESSTHYGSRRWMSE